MNRLIHSRIRKIGLILVALVGLLAIVYGWFAWRPTGYGGAQELTAEATAIVESRLRNLDSLSKDIIGQEADPPRSAEPATDDQSTSISEELEDALYSYWEPNRRLELRNYRSIPATEDLKKLGISVLHSIYSIDAGEDPFAILPQIIRNAQSSHDSKDPHTWRYAMDAVANRPVLHSMLDVVEQSLTQDRPFPDREKKEFIWRPLIDLAIRRAAVRGDRDVAQIMLVGYARLTCRGLWRMQQDPRVYGAWAGPFLSTIAFSDILLRVAQYGAVDDADLVRIDRMFADTARTPAENQALRRARAATCVEQIEGLLDEKKIARLEYSIFDDLLFGKLEPAVRGAIQPILRIELEQWALACIAGDEKNIISHRQTFLGMTRWLNLDEIELMDIRGTLQSGYGDEFNSRPNLNWIANELVYNREWIDERADGKAEEVRLAIAAARFRVANRRWPESIEELRSAGLIPGLIETRDSRWAILRVELFYACETPEWDDILPVDPNKPEEVYARAVLDYRRAHRGQRPPNPQALAPYLPARYAPADFADRFHDWPGATVLAGMRRQSNPARLLSLMPYDRDLTTTETQAVREANPGWNCTLIVLPDETPDPAVDALLKGL